MTVGELLVELGKHQITAEVFIENPLEGTRPITGIMVETLMNLDQIIILTDFKDNSDTDE
jgi:hypothetical protein